MYIVLCVYCRKVWKASGIMLKKAFVQSGRSNYSKKPILDKKSLMAQNRLTFALYFHNNTDIILLPNTNTSIPYYMYLCFEFLLEIPFKREHSTLQK